MKINLKHDLYKKFGIYLVLLAMIIIASFISPAFMTQLNITNLLTQIAVVTVIACGMTVLIVENMTDLSAGSVVALSGCLCVGSFIKLKTLGVPLVASFILSLLLAMIIGLVCNLISGFIVIRFKAPAFIVTLAMMQMARGAVFVYTEGTPIYGIGEISLIGQGKFLNAIPYSVIIMILVVAVSTFLMRKTRFGRYTYALGGNKEAAIASGINTDKHILKSYIFHGLLVGLAGVLYMTRLNSGQPAEGVALEFDAITAAIIGGTSFSGGVGTITGTLAGSFIIGIIKNILNLLSVQSYYQQIITGAIIVMAVIIDLMSKGGRNNKNIKA